MERRKVDLASLARVSSINRTSLSRLFNGETKNIRESTLLKIASGLGLTVEMLMDKEITQNAVIAVGLEEIEFLKRTIIILGRPIAIDEIETVLALMRKK